MPSKASAKTYERRPKKVKGSYVSKPVSPFKITGASTAVDALFSRNFKKRYSSENEEEVVNKPHGKGRKLKVSEVPQHHPLLNDDSVDVKINSTFDNLFQGSVYVDVPLHNNSSFSRNATTDTSTSKNDISEKVQSCNSVRLKKDICTGKHSNEKNNLEKVKKRKNIPKKLKKTVNNIVTKVSSTKANDVSKKMHRYLDESINCSIPKQNNQSYERTISCAKKFTSIAASKKFPPNNLKNNILMMQASNAPRFMHSSTPIEPRKIKLSTKLNVSPITASVKTKLNFTADNSSIGKNMTDISSIRVDNTPSKNVSSVVFINSTGFSEPRNIHKISEKLITNNKTDLVIPSIQGNCSIDKISVPKNTKNRKTSLKRDSKKSSNHITAENGFSITSNNSKSLFVSENTVDSSSSAILINSTKFIEPQNISKLSENIITNNEIDLVLPNGHLSKSDKRKKSLLKINKKRKFCLKQIGLTEDDIKLNAEVQYLEKSLDKLSISRTNFAELDCTSVKSKSLFENENIINLSSFQNDVVESSAIFINTSVESQKSYKIENLISSIIQNEENIIFKNITQELKMSVQNNNFASTISNDVKFNSSPIVILEKLDDFEEINKNVVCSFTNSKIDTKFELFSVECLKTMSFSKSSNTRSITVKSNEKISLKKPKIVEKPKNKMFVKELKKRSPKKSLDNGNGLNEKAPLPLEKVENSQNKKSISKYSVKKTRNSKCVEEYETRNTKKSENRSDINEIAQLPSVKFESSKNKKSVKKSISPKKYTKNKKSLILNDIKLNTKAVVCLEKLENIDTNKNSVHEIYPKNELVPIVLLEKLDLSKYHDTGSQNGSTINIIETSYIEEEKHSRKLKISSTYSYKKETSKRLSQNLLKSVLHKTTKTLEKPRSRNKSYKRRVKNLIDNNMKNLEPEYKEKISIIHKLSEQNIRKTRNSYKRNVRFEITTTEETYSSRISKSNNQLLVGDVNSVEKMKPTNFVTTRRGKLPLHSKSTVCQASAGDKKPPNISLETWRRCQQCKVLLKRINTNNVQKSRTETNFINDGTNTDLNKNDSIIADLGRRTIFLKPGKQWFRSLSSFRRTQIHEISGKIKLDNTINEETQEHLDLEGTLNKIDDESILNDMKNKIYFNNKRSLGIRKSLKIVNLSMNDSSCLKENSVSSNKSGYVSTLAHESILESFNKLSLSTNLNGREKSAKQIILERCGQTDPIPFNDCYSSRTLKKCRKIGEGVYGEVFMYKSVDNKCRVMKVIPIEGNLEVNGERQKKFEEIISEIIIASELSNLRINNEFCTNGFAELLQIYCVQGKYPQHLLDLWDLYDEERGSENDSPDIFSDDQLYIVLELANGGQDLESYQFTNAEQTYTLFIQIVCTLAVAESALQFEHRDMHWGNILISGTDEATITFRLNGREFEVATKGIKVSIIDFTLSRMTYDNYCIYNDLASDPDLFVATGDYQFDIYRLMKQKNKNDWEVFEPYTNILWLDYTLEKMIEHARYVGKSTKKHKLFLRRLSDIRKKILNYNSATELLNSDVFSHVFL